MKLVLIKYRERFRRVLMAHTGYNELSAPDQSVVLGAGAPKAIALCSGMYTLSPHYKGHSNSAYLVLTLIFAQILTSFDP